MYVGNTRYFLQFFYPVSSKQEKTVLNRKFKENAVKNNAYKECKQSLALLLSFELQSKTDYETEHQ